MISLLRALSLCLVVHFISVGRGEFLDPPPNHAMRTMAEEETVLPCHYRDEPGLESVVVQVTWFKEAADGSREQIIAAHHRDGQTAFGLWSGRVHFLGSDPTQDSTLVIRSTEVTDVGHYTCHISTFPSGNFDQRLSLTVWTIPISSLEPVILVEGQSYRQAAACRSVARPLPSLSWDTELNGQSTNRTSDTGSVSSHYSLHPLRSMNGKKLDCLVWHPSLNKPRRLQNTVVVHYPPHAEVSGYGEDWFVGMETAMLHCGSGGNPKPTEFTWARVGGGLPEGVIPHPNGTLEFGRPLSAGDAGVYQCVVKNVVDSSKASVTVKVAAEEPERQAPVDNLLLMGVGGAAGGLLLLMLVVIVSVTCHHKRRNKKLERQLTVKDNEISNLVRQASFRRVNSDKTDSIEQMTEKNSLRVEGTIRASLSSLGDQALSRDSRSTLSGGWVGGGGGGGIGLDHLGRPALNNGSRRGGGRTLDRDEEKRLRVETFARNSTMSLQDKRMHPPLLPSPTPVLHSTEILRTRHGNSPALAPGDDGGGRVANGNRNQQHSPLGCGYPTPADEEDEEDEGLGGFMCPENQGRLARGDGDPDGGDRDDDDDPYGSETNSSLMMDAQHVHFQQQPHLANGTLRPKSRSPLPNPHASLIHKAQIV